MTFSTKSEWSIPAGLILLSIVPVLAGTMRLVQLAGGVAITPDSARFFAAPLPVVLHIVTATFFCIFGTLQFVPSLRRRKPMWHRMTGWVLLPCGLITALTGLWMTQFYPVGVNPPASFDGPILYAIRLLAGSAMAVSLCLGLAAALRRDILRHQAWMMRGFALGLGAGTQVFTHLPWFLFPSIQGEFARTLCMGAGWVINLAVAEWMISRHSQAGGTLRRSGHGQ
jgi:hypothetical protein